jgi:hypothetical protein
MSLVSEIKCPECGHWSQSTGKADAKCSNCGAHLEPERFSHETTTAFANANKKDDYFVVKDSDETITQIFKLFMNPLRWGSYYVALLFFILIAGMLAIFGILAAI